MNKEIIIDGTNVLNCPYFQENYGEYWQGYWEHNDICHEFYGSYCSDNPNCKFKIDNKKDGV